METKYEDEKGRDGAIHQGRKEGRAKRAFLPEIRNSREKEEKQSTDKTPPPPTRRERRGTNSGPEETGRDRYSAKRGRLKAEKNVEVSCTYTLSICNSEQDPLSRYTRHRNPSYTLRSTYPTHPTH